MTSKLVVNTIESDAGVSTVTFAGDISVTGSAGALSASTLSATNLTVNGNAYPNAGPLSNRNLIINGAMQVAQRGTSVTDITSSGYRTVDRFRPSMGTLGTWTIEQSSDAPDGFAYSHKFTCTTADASPAADDDIEMEYKVEAQDLQHLNYGSASAQAMTLSFWVKSNKTGAATVNILQPDNSNKSLSPTYTISSADTWEHKTISIPGDTAGAISNDTGVGLLFAWWLNSGSNSNSGTNQTTWTTLNSADKNASNLGVGGAVNDYWQITGVQLEVGTVATPFEHRSYGDELARCQRYCQVYGGATYTRFGISSAYANTGASVVIPLSTPMRTLPSITTTGNFRHELPGVASANITVFTMDLNGSDTSLIKYDVTHDSNGNFTGNKSGQVTTNNDTTARFILSAEL